MVKNTVIPHVSFQPEQEKFFWVLEEMQKFVPKNQSLKYNQA